MEEVEKLDAPNWLKELEARREGRLKGRLAHDSGAGSPCLNCKEKCPGLDLHFWRKVCKVCKCSKESHDVPAEDAYGWLHFELLGGKVRPTKILLPGREDKVQVDWMPAGQAETVLEYLKSLPEGELPISGSEAAQNRRQLLSKQLPLYDVDASLCHDLSSLEKEKIEEYVAYVRENCIGVGEIIAVAHLNRIVPQKFFNRSGQVDVLNSTFSKNLERLKINNSERKFPDKLHGYTMSSDLANCNSPDQLTNNNSLMLQQNMAKNNVPITEEIVEPLTVNIGAIKDLSYEDFPNYPPPPPPQEHQEKEDEKFIAPTQQLCHHCSKPFQNEEFAIKIDRCDCIFHATCFKCAGCNQLLADNFYFYDKESNKIYCGRDYAKIRGIPRCHACDELIHSSYCLAENSTFHLKHFCCFSCDEPLAGKNYVVEDQSPYCLDCFEQNKAELCNACLKPIKPDQQGLTLKDEHFHATEQCFACKTCKKSLFQQKLLLRNRQLFCSHDCFQNVP